MSLAQSVEVVSSLGSLPPAISLTSPSSSTTATRTRYNEDPSVSLPCHPAFSNDPLPSDSPPSILNGPFPPCLAQLTLHPHPSFMKDHLPPFARLRDFLCSCPLPLLVLTKLYSPFTDSLRATPAVKPSLSPEDSPYLHPGSQDCQGFPARLSHIPYRTHALPLNCEFHFTLYFCLWPSAHAATSSKYSFIEWYSLAPTLFLGQSLTGCLENLIPHLSRHIHHTSRSIQAVCTIPGWPRTSPIYAPAQGPSLSVCVCV